jgi:integrase/recombinase XerD
MPASRPERIVRDYLDMLGVERGLSANTIAAYRRDLARYTAYLEQRGIRDLGEVTPADLSVYQQGLSTGDEDHKPLSTASVARAVVAVRNLHAFAASEGATATNPAADVSVPKIGKRLPKALSLSEVKRLIDGIETDTPAGLRDKALLELLYGTGARISEAVGLDVDDVTRALPDPDAGLRLKGKGGKQRVVPLGSFARAALDAYLVRGRPALLEGAKAATPALFLGTRGGRLSRQNAWLVLRDRAAAAGIAKDVSPHSLRHSFATHLLDGGADIRVVQELLGHASVTTTQIYTMVTVDHLREVYALAHPRAR